tara:strand:+ start:944 stop:1834 length:891 start_codon:yes stop_codon:yes gene_type:complete
MPDSFAYLPDIWTDDPSKQHGIAGLSVKKVDVSGSGMIFRTCSGITNAGSATSASKSADLKLALNWLYNKKNFKVRSNYPNGFTGGVGTEYTVNFSLLGSTEPLNRIKAVANAQQIADGFDGMGLGGFAVTRFESGFAVESFASTANSNNILTRMYNGNVNNEDNFIGYGVSGFTSAIQSDDMSSIGGTDTNITTAFGMFYGRATGRYLRMKIANYVNTTGFLDSGDAFRRTIFSNTNVDGVNFITLATGGTLNIGDPPPQVSLSIGGGSGGLFGINWSSEDEQYFVQFTETNDWF